MATSRTMRARQRRMAIPPDSPRRQVAVDALRGLVIVLMALDHAREFFHAGAMMFQPTDLARTTPVLFFTRWVTHVCAPTFALLAGVGAGLRLGRPGETPGTLARYLLTRGAALVLLELVVMRLAMNFSVSMAYPVLLLVLWMLGLSMMALALLVRVPPRLLLLLSLAVIALHNVADGVRAADLGPLAGVWRVLHEPGVVVLKGIVLVVGYPLVPWVAVMAAGFALAGVFSWKPERRQRTLVACGLGMCAGFVVLRLLNVYGDPVPWSTQATGTFTVLSFLNTTKYPPSLAFLLMALGPALLLLAALERRALTPGHPLVVLGRVPLLFYVAHFWALHAMAAVTAWAVYGHAAWRFLWMPPPSMGGSSDAFPAGYGYPLWGTYLAWVAVLILLWPLCRKLAGK
jgi:uncharacterized membrane protein